MVSEMNEQRYINASTPTNPVERLAEIIWHNKYLIKIAQKHLASNEEIKMFGSLTTGFEEIDRTIGNQLTQVMISINDMVEYYKLGINIYIVQESDSEEIYETIVEYLQAWNETLNNAINVSPPPVEDLLLLDRFANTLFGPAKAYHDHNPHKVDIISSSFGVSSRVTPQSLLGMQSAQAAPPKYRTMSNIISQGVAERRQKATSKYDDADGGNSVDQDLFKTKWDD